MLTVAVIAQKGGVGKTTLALHLAVEAAKAGPAVIVDIDPQSSAAQWADGRMAKEPAVVACPPARLAVALQAARNKGARFAFIDSAPAVESAALAAVRAADFCLIVSRPGILDLRSIGVNVEIAKLAGKPVAAVINAAPAQGGQAAAAARIRPQMAQRRGLPDHRPPARRVRPRLDGKPVRAGGEAGQQGRDRDRRPVGLARTPRLRPISRRGGAALRLSAFRLDCIVLRRRGASAPAASAQSRHPEMSTYLSLSVAKRTRPLRPPSKIGVNRAGAKL